MTIDLDGVRGGFAPTPAPNTGTAPTAAPRAGHDRGGDTEKVVGPAPLVPGSPAAVALSRVWSGEPVTLVDSPPGGGKTTLVATVVAHLVARADLNVTVAANTREQAVALAHRFVDQLPTAQVVVAVKSLPTGALPDGVASSMTASKAPGAKVTIRTLASCAINPPTGAIMLIDEAYQATFSQVARAASGALQVLLVGDPGQIGPVVTVDTSSWEHLRAAPHRRAPEVFALRPDATAVSIAHTYRLGPDSAAAIAPFYAFPFTSARPQRELVGPDGELWPELRSVRVPTAEHHDDLDALRIVADTAAALVGCIRIDTDPATGDEDDHVLADADVAVVVSHNSQASVVTGMLAEAHPGIKVGTADRLQGGEWSAVVALDPTVGYVDPSAHSVHNGRACVMASRHTTHLTWVHDGGWDALLRAAGNNADTRAARTVRAALTVNEVRVAGSGDPQVLAS